MIFLGFGWEISFRKVSPLKRISISDSSCPHSRLLVLKTCSGELVFPFRSFIVFPATVSCSGVARALGKCPKTLSTATDVVWRRLTDLNQCSVLVFEAALLPNTFVALSCHFLCRTKHPTVHPTLLHCSRGRESSSRRCCLLPWWAPVMTAAYLLPPSRALSRTWSWFSLPTATLRSALTLIAVSGLNGVRHTLFFFPSVQ